ncbi:MAG TPA: exodeoxyribonuclease VII large subunit [Candidatus Thermoplasmatota archaeon]|nr:exodeoxyribonuclease VII large subunit [Candidatus Thermoplasmatota archaeon]
MEQSVTAPRREPNLGSFSTREAETQVAVRAVSDGPPARTVSELILHVNGLMAGDPSLATAWVRGEISGFKPASSGHWYFDLKDDRGVLAAAMFRGSNARVKFQPQDGMEVLARGKVQVYGDRSKLQIVVDELRPVGAGELALRFEELKRKLAADGLFAQARKRPIPPFPRAVGIVTSLQAAALRDMVRVATARHPGVRLVVVPARVQGDGAAAEVAAGIARLNAQAQVDVIIVGRGGGSVEDLWAFNEEAVVRAVAGSAIPVVSAVGHETDFTLCDLAADLRAATPSNACELVVPDAAELQAKLYLGQARMAAALERLVPELRQRLDELERRSVDGVLRTLAKERELLAAHAARLDALSPLATLDRGYAVVRKGEHTLRSAKALREGDELTLTMMDGDVDAKVTGTRTKPGARHD